MPSESRPAPCPPRILELVEKFRLNLGAYKSPNYKEAQLRQEFLDPFFAELGWDMDNAAGAAPQYREVIHEDAISISGTTKAPDYCFTLSGARKFFVEAKKPAVDLLEDKDAAYQLRRYGWTAKLPLSVLTDFEHFIVYDTRYPPKAGDPASKARIFVIHFEEYKTRWSGISNTFSKEGVLKGRFDIEAAKKSKRGTAEVDDAFLQEIESWREQLAANLKLRNQDLEQLELNYAVQAIIDRIIFLRICEDRGIEPSGRLKNCAKESNVYERLVEIFQEADAKYNSGLFHFKDEKGRSSAADRLTPGLSVDSKVLKGILENLYYPNSPYEFSILPTEVLGHVYEQFLGSVIVVTDKRARVEPKPEVKKAGGVFYTPSYIVDEIVKSTIGKLIEEKTVEEVSELRIVDPACGSGSFLLGAYQFLLDWHLDQYRKNPRKWKQRLVDVVGGKALTTEERSRILLNNTYGVDIDSQAVEVTKLSLLLKVLEKTPGEVLETQLKLTHKRALPDLGSNIKCGNTLLDYRHLGQTLLDDETRRRVNPFDWKKEFQEIFAKNGGFDAVIGNPPYIRVQTMTEWAPLEVELYKNYYKAASKGNYDIYVCFVERGLWLLNKHGRLGYILPHKFFNAKYGEPLRELVSAGRHLANVIHFGDQQVFRNATTYTCLLFLAKGGASEVTFIDASDLQAWRLEGKATVGSIPAEKVGSKDWNFSVGEGATLFEKLSHMPTKLGDVASRMGQGVRTSANEIYVLTEVAASDEDLLVSSVSLGKDVHVEPGATQRFLQGREIKPYEVLPSGKRVLMPYRINEGKAVLIREADLASQFPKAHAYLVANKQALEAREKGRFMGPDWHQFGRNQNIDLMLLPKILIPDIADRAAFALDEDGEYAFTSGYGITLKADVQESIKYVLGLLNSILLDFYLKHISTTMRGGYFRYFTQFIQQLPIRRIDFSETREKAQHDQLVVLVNQVLNLHKNLQTARAQQEKTSIQRQIDATRNEIDHLVFKLYGLTDDEVELLEGTFT